MLIKLESSRFDDYIDFAYELAMDPARSGYPTYLDGIKTREDFIARSRMSLERPDEEILLFVEDGEVEGWIAYGYQEQERYLHAHGFYTRRDTGRALAEFVDHCRACWPGHVLDLGFPAENEDAIAWLEGEGIPCIERSWNFQSRLDRYEPLPEPPGVKRIGSDDFEDFAAVHLRIQSDMYWDCDRIRKTLDDWIVLVIGEGPAAGELLMTGSNSKGHHEIFALAFADGQYRDGPFRALLTAGLNVLKRRGAKWLTFFVDVGSPEGEVLTGLGFHLVGTYLGYRVEL